MTSIAIKGIKGDATHNKVISFASENSVSAYLENEALFLTDGEDSRGIANFYDRVSKSTTFHIDGEKLPIDEFFATLNAPELAEPLKEQADTNSYHEWDNIELANGIDHLHELDYHSNRNFKEKDEDDPAALRYKEGEIALATGIAEHVNSAKPGLQTPIASESGNPDSPNPPIILPPQIDSNHPENPDISNSPTEDPNTSSDEIPGPGYSPPASYIPPDHADSDSGPSNPANRPDTPQGKAAPILQMVAGSGRISVDEGKQVQDPAHLSHSNQGNQSFRVNLGDEAGTIHVGGIPIYIEDGKATWNKVMAITIGGVELAITDIKHVGSWWEVAYSYSYDQGQAGQDHDKEAGEDFDIEKTLKISAVNKAGKETNAIIGIEIHDDAPVLNFGADAYVVRAKTFAGGAECWSTHTDGSTTGFIVIPNSQDDIKFTDISGKELAKIEEGKLSLALGPDDENQGGQLVLESIGSGRWAYLFIPNDGPTFDTDILFNACFANGGATLVNIHIDRITGGVDGVEKTPLHSVYENGICNFFTEDGSWVWGAYSVMQVSGGAFSPDGSDATNIVVSILNADGSHKEWFFQPWEANGLLDRIESENSSHGTISFGADGPGAIPFIINGACDPVYSEDGSTITFALPETADRGEGTLILTKNDDDSWSWEYKGSSKNSDTSISFEAVDGDGDTISVQVPIEKAPEDDEYDEWIQEYEPSDTLWESENPDRTYLAENQAAAELVSALTDIPQTEIAIMAEIDDMENTPIWLNNIDEIREISGAVESASSVIAPVSQPISKPLVEAILPDPPMNDDIPVEIAQFVVENT